MPELSEALIQKAATAVPGAAPSTPPTFPSGGAQGGVEEQARQILDMLRRTMQQRRFAGSPRPAAVPGLQDPREARNIGMGTSWPHAWGFERFAAQLGSNLQNVVARQKEAQIQKAEAIYDYYGNLMNSLSAAQATGDQAQVQAAQAKLDNFYREPSNIRALHQAAKALNQSWLDPEKTTVWGTGMQRSLAKRKERDQARSGLSRLFQHVVRLGQAPKAQLNPEESVEAGRQVQEKVPSTPGAPTADLKTFAEFERAVAQAREKYQYVTTPEGVLAVNKDNPKDAHFVRDKDTGELVKGKTPPKEGTVYTVNGMPLGVFHSGQPVTPTDQGWTDRDQKFYDAALVSAKEKQFLRVEPAIAAMMGDPPNPAQYKGGRASQEYRAALKTWGDEVFRKEKEKASAMGEARAIAWNKYRPVDVMDEDGNVYYTTAQKAIEEGLAGAGQGVKLKSREAQIKDIETASAKARAAIVDVDKPFDVSQIAKLKFAMTTDDPSLARTEMMALANQNLTEKQQDFVIWINQLNERAMSLRQVAGIGQGAQDVRNAIRAMLPGLGSGSKQMMEKQLSAFDQQVRVLKSGIAHPGKPKTGRFFKLD